METAPTLDQVVQRYLAWCRRHRSPHTAAWYAGHLSGFLAHLGDSRAMPVTSLKPYHVVEWVDSRETWGGTYRRGAIVAVQRALSWAEQMGYIDANPLKRVQKPAASRRDNPMAPDDYRAMLALLPGGDPFRDVLVFAWETGARPQEIRHIEPRHVDLPGECVVIPKEEAKGKRRARVIHLYGPALDVVARLMAERTGGKLFGNARGGAWTRHGVCNRMGRLSGRIGRRYALYDCRHAFCQRLLEAGVSLPAVAELMGHANSNMVSSVYSHMGKATAHLKDALRQAGGRVTG